MASKRKLHQSKKIRNSTLLLVTVLVLGGAAFLIWHATRGTPKVSGPMTPVKQLSGQTTTTSPKKINETSTVNQGTSTDNNGKAPAPITSSPSDWTQSQSGLIVVQQPLANATFTSGDTLSGTAKVAQVQYTLIDDQVGVISQGTINVVDGKFSASVNFKPYASTGRLDIFSTTQDGREDNEVQLSVKF